MADLLKDEIDNNMANKVVNHGSFSVCFDSTREGYLFSFSLDFRNEHRSHGMSRRAVKICAQKFINDKPDTRIIPFKLPRYINSLSVSSQYHFS